MIKKFLLLFCLCLASCSKEAQNSQNIPPTALVTVAPYAYFTEAIAGDTLTVQTLVPSGVNLHIFEPTPKQVEGAIKANVWFRIDDPFERKIILAIQEKNPNQTMVNLQAGISLISNDSELGTCACCEHGEDLHTWLSPKIAKQQAKKIYDTLSALFPENQALYQKNHSKLQRELSALDEAIKTKLAPFRGDAILTSHPAFAYFCKEYHLIQLSVECEGKDPRPKDVEEIFLKAKKLKPRTALLQVGFNNQGAKLIAQKLDIPTVSFNPNEKDYPQNMKRLAEYIAQ